MRSAANNNNNRAHNDDEDDGWLFRNLEDDTYQKLQRNDYDYNYERSDVSENYKTFVKAIIFMGRSNEDVILLKARCANHIVILVGFLVAFMIHSVLTLDLDRTFGTSDEPSFLLGHFYAVLLSVSISSGLYCIVVFTFLSIKIHRLFGRGLYRWGGGDNTKNNIDDLIFFYGKDRLFQLVKECTTKIPDNTRWQVRFPARKFYYEGIRGKISGKTLFVCGMCSFWPTLIGFGCTICAKLSYELDRPYSLVCIVLMISGIVFSGLLTVLSEASVELQ